MLDGDLNGTERAVFGRTDVAEVADLVDRYLRSRLGASVDRVLFRAGRIDAVWAVRMTDGRQVVVKAHRPPVDLPARSAAVRAQSLLEAAGFPCPVPLSGPDELDGVVMSIETLTSGGSPADGRDPVIRRAVAAGLVDHIDLLRRAPEMIDLAGRGPAWCRYQAGPWPVPHDPIFDFTSTPPGFDWLDRFARDAAQQILRTRASDTVVVGHADWYVGNARFDDGRLVASYDWDLVADTEPVVAGMAAGCFTASSTNEAGLPSPAEAAAFLTDYDAARGTRFTDRQQQSAAAAAAWIVAYGARCELSLTTGESKAGSPLQLAREHGADYLGLRW